MSDEIKEDNNDVANSIDRCEVVRASNSLFKQIQKTNIIPETLIISKYEFTIPEYLYIAAKTIKIIKKGSPIEPTYQFGILKPEPEDESLIGEHAYYFTSSIISTIVDNIIQSVKTKNRIPSSELVFSKRDHDKHTKNEYRVLTYNILIVLISGFLSEYLDNHGQKPDMLILDEFMASVFKPRFEIEEKSHTLHLLGLQYENIKQNNIEQITIDRKDIEEDNTNTEEEENIIQIIEKAQEELKKSEESKGIKYYLNPYNWF